MDRFRLTKNSIKLMILVKGDDVSIKAKAFAKKIGYCGPIVEMSLAKARLQHTPLPLIFTKDHYVLDPTGILAYLNKKSRR